MALEEASKVMRGQQDHSTGYFPLCVGRSGGGPPGGRIRHPRAWGACRGGEVGMGADPQQHVVTIN